MILFPAIDLYDRKAVRLYKGDYNQMTVYSENPIEIARDFSSCGATHIHMVDLEGAKDGTTPNLSIVEQIAKETDLFVEIGGGIRNMETVEKYLSCGIGTVRRWRRLQRIFDALPAKSGLFCSVRERNSEKSLKRRIFAMNEMDLMKAMTDLEDDLLKVSTRRKKSMGVLAFLVAALIFMLIASLCVVAYRDTTPNYVTNEFDLKPQKITDQLFQQIFSDPFPGRHQAMFSPSLRPPSTWKCR